MKVGRSPQNPQKIQQKILTKNYYSECANSAEAFSYSFASLNLNNLKRSIRTEGNMHGEKDHLRRLDERPCTLDEGGILPHGDAALYLRHSANEAADGGLLEAEHTTVGPAGELRDGSDVGQRIVGAITSGCPTKDNVRNGAATAGEEIGAEVADGGTIAPDALVWVAGNKGMYAYLFAAVVEDGEGELLEGRIRAEILGQFTEPASRRYAEVEGIIVAESPRQ